MQGLGLLTLSVVLPLPSPSHDCQKGGNTTCYPPHFRIIFFFFSLYLLGIGVGARKAGIQAFGADQFDGRNHGECIGKSSYFNWWLFGVLAGTIAAQSVLSYIQENLNWGLGFGIPCIVMTLGVLLFLLGSRTYRYNIKHHERSPFMRIGQVFIAAAKNWLATPSEDIAGGSLHQQDSQQFK